MRGCKDGGSRIDLSDRVASEALDGLSVGATYQGR
jgi:hypothetical protein